MKIANALPVILLATLLCGCVDLQYYGQSVKGHLGIIRQTQDIEELLAEKTIDPALAKKLRLVLQARNYAADTLQLSFNNSYNQYADLHRDYVVKNLYAAPEFSIELYTWCYPIIGCANYRGFFDEQMMSVLHSELDSQGYDTYVSNVTAYSTLGWFADPVLNTFVTLLDYQLVALVFHELAHQQIFISGDTFFNESFAMAVEQAGIKQFYSAETDQDQLSAFRKNQQRVATLVNLAVQARTDLGQVYELTLSNTDKRSRKHDILKKLTHQYRELTDGALGPHKGAAPALGFNNARLGAVAAYHKYVPAFLHILASHDSNFAPFYTHVAMLGELNQEQRTECLIAWSKPPQALDAKIPGVCMLSSR